MLSMALLCIALGVDAVGSDLGVGIGIDICSCLVVVSGVIVIAIVFVIVMVGVCIEGVLVPKRCSHHVYKHYESYDGYYALYCCASWCDC